MEMAILVISFLVIIGLLGIAFFMSNKYNVNNDLNPAQQLKNEINKIIVSIVIFFLLGAILFIMYGIANDQIEIALPCLLVSWGLAIMIWVKLFIAKQFYSVAKMKGYTDVLYFKLTFYLPFAGYFLVIALPNRRKDADA